MAQTAFSFGYDGWGSSGRDLLDVTARVEASRGYGPPVFVDVRISRSVRAHDFREDAFRRLAGDDRYTWMRGLGNQSILEGDGSRVRIAEPEAVVGLLDRVLRLAADRRRLLFFCRCPFPWDCDRSGCHRHEVARLLREEARRRGTALATEEWPGGDPVEVTLEVTAAFLRRLHGSESTRSVPLSGEPSLDLAGLPFASRVELTCGSDRIWRLARAARKTARGWALPLLEGDVGPGWRADAETLRRETGCVRVEAGAGSSAAHAVRRVQTASCVDAEKTVGKRPRPPRR